MLTRSHCTTPRKLPDRASTTPPYRVSSELLLLRNVYRPRSKWRPPVAACVARGVTTSFHFVASGSKDHSMFRNERIIKTIDMYKLLLNL